MSYFKKLWRKIGPGFITGASDDDPSGIVTYSIAGAMTGLKSLWLALYTLPFMIAIQEMSGRIGLVTKKGLVGNIKEHYSKKLLIPVALLVVIANIINIGANIAGISASISLLLPSVNTKIVSSIIVVLIIMGLTFSSYRAIATYLKWVALALVAYVISAFFINIDWKNALLNAVVPHFSFTKTNLMILVAILGTTISPYLFFWQANQEAEEEHKHRYKHSGYMIKSEISMMNQDTKIGMIFSNIVMFFIIIVASTVIPHTTDITNISIETLANALKPLAGSQSNLLFLLGVLASGMLAIPVLAGSSAYALSEVFGWKEGMDKKPMKAPQFYIVLCISTILGLIMPILGIKPIAGLIYTAIIYGVISPILIALIMNMANKEKIMGKFTNGTISNILGYVLLIIMAISVILLLISI